MARRVIIFTFLLVFAGIGISRLRFETELTGLLPDDVAQVEAVKSFHQYFHDDHLMVVYVRNAEDKVYAEDIEDLSDYLEAKMPDYETLSESKYDEEDDLFNKEVARTWVLSQTPLVRELVEKVSDPTLLKNEFISLKEEIRSSFRSGQAMQSSYDPLGFMKHPGLVTLSKAEYSFESDDGKSRFFFMKRRDSAPSNDDAQWVEDVKRTLSAWNLENENAFSFGLTGGPVYSVDIGNSMKRDLFGTLSITLILISALFLILQRSLSQFLLLLTLVSLTFLCTLGIAGWLIPSLNIVSMAFAAILLGLVIDYAVVLLREAGHFRQDHRAMRKGMRGSILWATVTTTLVFSVLMLSSFPGVRQLGGLIIIGLFSGAIIMLIGVPWFFGKKGFPQSLEKSGKYRLGHHQALILPLLALGCILVFSQKGLPSFAFSLESLQPNTSEAAKVQQELSNEFISWSELRTVVFAKADSSKALEAKLLVAEKAANQLISDGLLESASIPAQLVPHHADYTENVRILKALYQDWDMISNIAKEVGFSEAGMKFNKTILEIISTLPNSLEEFLLNPLPNPVTQKMITEHDGQHYFRGDIVLTKPLTPQNLEKLSALNTDGVIMTGWSTLSATLQPMVKSDFKTLFLPAACVILLALGIVFRNLAETLLVVIILIVSLATVNAIMVLVGLQWNFLNGVAFPLIIGVGIDYGIHLIFSLRRHNGKESTKHGVGLAITFCGLSSIIGFGSLTFADNALLQSLGLISALGVAITMTLTLYVIPPVWRWLRLKR